MQEIDDIIRAVRVSYRRFADGSPDPETRVAVGNAVRFLIADLTSASELAENHKKGIAA
ncbi:hypothetical protein [Amycolatopsis sp. 195334CR]|uniref:hypothetical protein n=1 Tax=Amycolatopsis sp. 195334CR TaxID=2814588 RepID=UPI001A90744F|nr:hypothetical protein [Amycolatopsis sp. 195334CR]MBN6039114.1 hypothetical protein [Amycolatopsis sp. 195334CR]